jgi:murein endopeptidase
MLASRLLFLLAATGATSFARPLPPGDESSGSVGRFNRGSLAGGVALPLDGEHHYALFPPSCYDPNAPAGERDNFYGNRRTVDAVLEVARQLRALAPDAPRLAVGELSNRAGGSIPHHLSHQNGLDVDVYYPRRDETLRAPTRVDQVDRRLAQGLLDAFLAVGVGKVFVGYRTGLSGPGGVVEPYPNHEDHMHVRFRPPVDR